MFVGELVLERMQALGLDVQTLSKNSLVDEAVISQVISNTSSIDDLDEFDLDMICGVLYCSSDYFYSEEARRKDIISGSFNRGDDTPKSMKVKGNIQSFVNDFILMQDMMK